MNICIYICIFFFYISETMLCLVILCVSMFCFNMLGFLIQRDEGQFRVCPLLLHTRFRCLSLISFTPVTWSTEKAAELFMSCGWKACHCSCCACGCCFGYILAKTSDLASIKSVDAEPVNLSFSACTQWKTRRKRLVSLLFQFTGKTNHEITRVCVFMFIIPLKMRRNFLCSLHKSWNKRIKQK